MKPAVIFDLDNTFYPYAPAHAAGLDAACALAGPGLTEAYLTARKATAERLKGQAASHSRSLYFHGAVELLHKRSRPDLALELEAAYWKAYFKAMIKGMDHDTLPLLCALLESGRPLALATDLTSTIQFRKLDFLGLQDFFQAVVTSEEAGAEKPDPRVLELVFQKLGCPKEGAVFVGDDPAKDGGAARAAGIEFIHMGKDVKNFKELAQRLDLSIG